MRNAFTTIWAIVTIFATSLLAQLPANVPVPLANENDPTANVDLDVMIRNPHWDGTIATAHNGGILFGPQDTILVFGKSCEAGADIIEVDIRVTSDGHLIAFHDAEFNLFNSTGTGLIRERTLDYVRSIRTRSLIPGVANQPIPSFVEVLQFLKQRCICLNVEPKDNVIEQIIADVRAAGMENNVLIQAKSPQKAELIRRLDDRVGMIARYREEADVERYAPYHPEVMEVNPDVSDEIIARIRAMGTKVQMKVGYLKDLDFDEKSWQKRIGRGVNVALTDLVPQMIHYLRRMAFNIGNEAKMRQGAQGLMGYTYIAAHPELTAQRNGQIAYLRIFMHSAGVGKAKLFRPDAEMYNLVAETELVELRQGLNIIALEAQVAIGDCLGVYLQSGEIEAEKSTRETRSVSARGDVGSGAKNQWLEDNCDFSVDGMIR